MKFKTMQEIEQRRAQIREEMEKEGADLTALEAEVRELKENEEEIRKAAKDAAETEEQLQQIRRSELCWRYWKNANMRSEFSRLQFPYVYMKAGEDLHDDFKEMNVLVFGEGAQHKLSDCELLYLYRTVDKWTDLYEEWFWDILNPAAVALYEFYGTIYNLFNK